MQTVNSAATNHRNLGTCNYLCPDRSPLCCGEVYAASGRKWTTYSPLDSCSSTESPPRDFQSTLHLAAHNGSQYSSSSTQPSPTDGPISPYLLLLLISGEGNELFLLLETDTNESPPCKCVRNKNLIGNRSTMSAIVLKMGQSVSWMRPNNVKYENVSEGWLTPHVWPFDLQSKKLSTHLNFRPRGGGFTLQTGTVQVFKKQIKEFLFWLIRLKQHGEIKQCCTNWQWWFTSLQSQENDGGLKVTQWASCWCPSGPRHDVFMSSCQTALTSPHQLWKKTPQLQSDHQTPMRLGFIVCKLFYHCYWILAFFIPCF